ncbi:Unknown protein [Striga hermonthica]|uniref:F-box/LRR-repeat protein 15/At3g58940/PEG3-like LRR domain-containing protein n=1 Tax=Striga hermonthica TaxID=68872 RepID=A0A9N7N3S6_STRHE|nr:Unknown protein [Striga hermonthica]
MVGAFELPEQTIHHIQSFLTGKEAVRSSVLSKSWHRAWTTRPNLDFDEDDFRHEDNYSNPINFDEFLKFVNKTIKRYEEMKLKIDGLRLRVNSSSVLPKKLIPQALRMGATRLDIGGGFVVPNVVFKAENLVRLSVDDCKIKRHRVRVVKYPRLESLSLTNVEISSSVICRIISGCPSIKTLSLTNLLSSSGRLYCHGLAVEGRICCHALTTLVLCNVFFCGDDLFSEFPSLKDLTLHDLMTDLKEIRVSSRSLECLKLVSFPGSSLYHTFKLDVPSLRRFTFDGYLSQRMTFASASRNLVSCLTLIEEGHLSTTLFKKLGNFLTELGQSEVHLCLHLYLRTILNYVPGDFEGLPKHEVANFTIDVYDMSFINCYILFDGLFRIIRPKFVKHYLHPTSTSENTNNDFLGKRLLDGVNGSICSIESHFMRSVHDLKEVNVQLFDEDASEWTTISWDSFFDASTSTNRKQQVRFQLEWKP